MFAFMNNKAKADIKVLELYDPNNMIDYHGWRKVIFDISQYIDNADNYMIIGAEQYLMKNYASETGALIEKWFSCLSDVHMAAEGYVKNVQLFPTDYALYNSGSQRLIQIMMINPTSVDRKAKIRVMLMRIGDVISLI